MIVQRALEAIEASDTDELLSVVDGYCAAKDWDHLLDLRARCREAVGRGKQVWGVEEHIRYRLALEAPPQYAGPVVSEGQARFTLGPLPEVAASTKSFAEMDRYLAAGPARDTFAAERVVRGERLDIPVPDLPAQLQDWEPAYAVATYKSDKVEAPAPPLPQLVEVTLPPEFETITDPHSTGALSDLVEPWTDQSNGRCQTTAVKGDHLSAIRSLGLTHAGLAELEPPILLAWMSWAAASGGAHGRRRGAAAGRYLAWWAVATLAGVDWPAAADDVGKALGTMRWFWFDDGSPSVGWALRLAVHNLDRDIGWAIAAIDMSD